MCLALARLRLIKEEQVKNTIFVFSGTGNSLHIAKKLQGEIGDTNLIKVNHTLLQSPIVIDANIVGFIFPVHYFGPPVIIRQLIHFIKTINAEYIFALATNGGAVGNTLKIFSKLLKKKGASLQGAFSLLMPSNHIKMNETVMYGVDNEVKLKNADNEIASIAETIKKKETTPYPGDNIIFSLFSLFWNPIYVKQYKSKTNKLDQNFVLSDNCTGCGICRKICPLNNITLNHDCKPEWHHTCECCMACIQWCPERAIEYGTISPSKQRYHNPNISLNEMFFS